MQLAIFKIKTLQLTLRESNRHYEGSESACRNDSGYSPDNLGTSFMYHAHAS